MRQSPGCRASVFRQHPIQFQFLGGISAYDPTWRLCPIVTQAPQPFRLVMESTWPLDCAAAAPWLGRFSLPRQGHPLRPLRTRQSRWRGIRQRLLGALPDDEIDSNRDHKTSHPSARDVQAALASPSVLREPAANTIMPTALFPSCRTADRRCFRIIIGFPFPFPRPPTEVTTHASPPMPKRVMVRHLLSVPRRYNHGSDER
jgi:hypothetical protein